MSEEDFLHYVLPSFRYTLYVTRGAGVRGRFKLGPWIFDSRENLEIASEESDREGATRTDARSHVGAGEIVIIDRMGGSLGASFLPCVTSAAGSLSTTFTFTHYTSRSINFTQVILPTVSASLSTLSSSPSILDLQLYNIEFHRQLGRSYDIKYGQDLLLDILSFLEAINVISFLYVPKNFKYFSGKFNELRGAPHGGTVKYPSKSYVPAVRAVPTSTYYSGDQKLLIFCYSIFFDCIFFS